MRDALRGLNRPAGLATNPLLRSRLIVDQIGDAVGTPEREVRPRRTLVEAAQALGSDPRNTKLQRALHHTYVQPAPTQAQTAELLDLPFSTYRRHLTAGIAAVTELLWRRELGDIGPSGPATIGRPHRPGSHAPGDTALKVTLSAPSSMSPNSASSRSSAPSSRRERSRSSLGALPDSSR